MIVVMREDTGGKNILLSKSVSNGEATENNELNSLISRTNQANDW